MPTTFTFVIHDDIHIDGILGLLPGLQFKLWYGLCLEAQQRVALHPTAKRCYHLHTTTRSLHLHQPACQRSSTLATKAQRGTAIWEFPAHDDSL